MGSKEYINKMYARNHSLNILAAKHNSA